MSIKGIYDIHCHIVPGVDDGATDIGETVKLLRMEYEQGVRTVIATPHFRFRMFETPAEKVREQFRLVEKAASEISPDLHVYLGCEFHANMEMLPMLREQKVMTMAGSRYVLTEFSHNSETSTGAVSIDAIKKQLLQDKEFLAEIEKSMGGTSCREVEKTEPEDSDNLDMDEDMMLAGMSMFENEI